jgi:thioredoxin-related protein
MRRKFTYFAESNRKKMKRVFIIMTLVLVTASMWGQTAKVKWYTIQEAEQLIKKSPRPMMIDTYTDWCGWCKKLDADTFSNAVIAEILNTRFYPVKFNAEGKDPIVFQGDTYINDGKSGPTHQLAIKMIKGQTGYPNIVFFNDKIQLLTNVAGYMPPKDLEVILNFFADKAYEKQQTFEAYRQAFRGKVQ